VKPQQDIQSRAVARPGETQQVDVAGRQDEEKHHGADAHQRRGLLVSIVRLGLQAVIPILILAGSLATYSYMKATKPEVRKRAPREAAYAVKSVPVTIADIAPVLKLYGTTAAGRQVEIRSLVAGRVIETGEGLRDGGEVEVGATLLKIDPFDFEIKVRETKSQLAEATARLAEMKASVATEQGNLKFIEAQVELARTDLGRAAPLAKRGTVSERTVDDRRLIVSQREQALTQTRNNVAVWNARIDQQEAVIERLRTTIEQSQKRVAEATLKAPFNAYVFGIGAQVGRMLNANDSVATLIDRDWIDVRFTLTNEQFGRLVQGRKGLIGREVELEWRVGQAPLRYSARIERLGARVTSNTGGVDVYARIVNPLQPVAIRPGAFVEATLKDAVFEKVAQIPSTAVYDSSRVYVIEKGRLQGRKVRILATSGSDVLVEGELKTGDRVVTTRLSTPGDGVRVQEQRGNGA